MNRIISDLEKKYEVTASEFLGGHFAMRYNRYPDMSLEEATEATARHFASIIGNRKDVVLCEINSILNDKPFPWKLIGWHGEIYFNNEQEAYDWFKSLCDIFKDELNKMEMEKEK